jgi:hypothetical protein
VSVTLDLQNMETIVLNAHKVPFTIQPHKNAFLCADKTQFITVRQLNVAV